MKQYWKQTTAALSAAALTACMLPCMTSAQTVPCPVLSRNCPAYAGNGQASSANDEHYFSFWFSNAPDYLAYDLSAASQEERSRVILAWYNATGQYDPSILNGGSTNGVPSAYTIEINDAPGGTYPEDGWQVVDTVTGNTLHSRQHVIDLNGTANWVRMSISEGDGKSGGSISLQMDIHSAPEGKLDSWIFFGDSITAGGMMNCYGSPFAELVHAIDSKYFPAQENGGIGGIFSTDGKNNIDRWLASFPGEYVSVAYGTNDAWGNQTGAEKYYENTVYMMEAILASGKTPVLPTIPYATESGVNTYLDDYNAMVHKIYEEYPQVVKGPDFYSFLKEHPEHLSADGVHPSSEGYAAMRQLWAETMYENVYTAKGDTTEHPTTPTPENRNTDLNGDGVTSVLDIVLLQKYLFNLEQLTPAQYDIADYSLDDVVDAYDLAFLKRIVFHLYQ